MATRVDISIDQGTTFESNIDLTDQDGLPLDVAGMSARAQLRKNYASSNSVSFVANLTTGNLKLSLTSTETEQLISGRYVYDVELVDASNNVTRLIEGVIHVSPEVTR